MRASRWSPMTARSVVFSFPGEPCAQKYRRPIDRSIEKLSRSLRVGIVQTEIAVHRQDRVHRQIDDLKIVRDGPLLV